MPSDWVAASAPLPDDLNAAPLYREAARRLQLTNVQRTAGESEWDTRVPPDLDSTPLLHPPADGWELLGEGRSGRQHDNGA